LRPVVNDFFLRTLMHPGRNTTPRAGASIETETELKTQK
jgi:hypothetical protein